MTGKNERFDRGVVSRSRADAFDSDRRKQLSERATRLKVLTIEAEEVVGRDGAQSKKLEPEDSLIETYLRDGKILARPLDFEFLSELGEYSGTLFNCVQAMEINIDGFGHKIVPINPTRDDGATRQEYADLVNFFTYAYLDGSFVDLRRKLRQDREYTGNAYAEVIRVPSTGKLDGFEHLASRDMWLGRLSKKRFECVQKRLVLLADGTHKLEEVNVFRRFRTYFQSKDGGVTGVWFKDFGDPRVIDIETGEEVTGNAAHALPELKRANELIHLRHYCARSPYGIPRYIAEVLTIFGDRSSTEINYTTLKRNNIPAMILLVSNGLLTEGTIDRLKEFSEEQRTGKKDYSRFLVVEAEGDLEGEHTNVKLETRPLTDVQQQDELFKEYSKSNARKIRQIFRLPPILIGAGEAYNRATAEVSRKLAEEQVFAPEREEFDRFVNRTILPELGAKNFLFKSNSPNVTNDEDLIKVLQVAEKTGAMTPRIARMIIEDIMNRSLGAFPKDGELPLDVPFTLTMAERVKNKAAMSVPTQVAPDAVETVKALTGSNPGALVEGLVDLRRTFEAMLTPWEEYEGETPQDETS